MDKSHKSEHALWMEKMIRGGLETMCLEHLKDESILKSHPLEDMTRHLLRYGPDQCSVADCWNIWGSAVFSYSEYTSTGLSDVPEHFQSSMDCLAKHLIRRLQEATRGLKEAANAFVLSRETDEDRAEKDHHMQLAQVSAEQLLEESKLSGPPEFWQLPEGRHKQILLELVVLEEHVRSCHQIREVEAQAEVAAQALAQHLAVAKKPWEEIDASTAMGETGSFRDTGFTTWSTGFRSNSPEVASETKASPDMLATVLAEHGSMSGACQEELEEFLADFHERRRRADNHIGLLSVMRKISAFRHD
ncbi:unnamed protein product [Effrenium voratum]|nr:unnamed protein product [Effrenium voratum]